MGVAAFTAGDTERSERLFWEAGRRDGTPESLASLGLTQEFQGKQRKAHQAYLRARNEPPRRLKLTSRADDGAASLRKVIRAGIGRTGSAIRKSKRAKK
jgi:hypothetical protein